MKKSELRKLIKEEILKESLQFTPEEKKEGQQMEMKVDVLSTIDELNQFLNGNVTADGLKDALESMIYKLNRLNYK